LTYPEPMNRLHADTSEQSQDKRHRALLTVETKSICDDTKPVFSANSQSSHPRRRILPEADNTEFDFFQPSCSVLQFRSPIVTTALALNNVCTGVAEPSSHAVDEYRRELKKHDISSTEYFNNMRNSESVIYLTLI